MILHVITRYYTLLHVIMCYYMLLHVITCYYMLLHVIHVIACYCMLLHVITCYYMLLGFEFRQSVSSRIGYMTPPTYFEKLVQTKCRRTSVRALKRAHQRFANAVVSKK